LPGVYLKSIAACLKNVGGFIYGGGFFRVSIDFIEFCVIRILTYDREVISNKRTFVKTPNHHEGKSLFY
jgi:hypothetical protein